MRSLFADINGPVHYLDFGGEGRPIVLVHGLGGSALNWQALAPPLTCHGHVYAVDLAGFGRTPLEGRSSRVDANRELLNAFLKQVVGQPALLVGNSMGGLLSLLAASAEPESTAGLVLVDPAVPFPILGKRPHPRVIAAFAAASLPYLGARLVELRIKLLGHESVIHDMFQLSCVDAGRIDKAVLEAHLELARERGAKMPWANAAFADAARSVVHASLSRARFRQQLANVKAPTLIVHGEKDSLVPVESVRELATLRPDFSLKVLPGVGHMPQLEAPKETLALIEEWLRGEALRSAA